MRVAIVCEGSSDYPILKSIVEIVLGQPATFSAIQPDFDALARRDPVPGPGWHGIRDFLARPDLDVAAGIHDLIVVQVDADVGSSREIAGTLRVATDEEDDLEPLCELVKSWVKRALPASAVITLPKQSTETWLVAAHTRRTTVEDITNPAQVLLDNGLIEATTKGKPDKAAHKYEELSRALNPLIADSRKLN